MHPTETMAVHLGGLCSRQDFHTHKYDTDIRIASQWTLKALLVLSVGKSHLCSGQIITACPLRVDSRRKEGFVSSLSGTGKEQGKKSRASISVRSSKHFQQRDWLPRYHMRAWSPPITRLFLISLQVIRWKQGVVQALRWQQRSSGLCLSWSCPLPAISSPLSW